MPVQPASSSVAVVLASDHVTIPVSIAATVATSTVVEIDPALVINEYVLNGGSNDMGIDGTTPVTFSYAPPSGKNLRANRAIMYMESSGAMDSTKFGDLTALTNGVQIKADSEVLANWQDNVDILTNMFDLTPAGETFGKLTRTLVGRWTFTKDTSGLGLLVPDGQSFDMVIRDNLAALLIFRMKIKGVLTNA